MGKICMMLEKNYYSEEKKLWEDAEMEVKEHKNESPSDAETFLKFFKGDAGSSAEKISKNKCKAGTACKYVSRDRFSELTEEASCIAAAAPMDIKVTSDQTGGQIRMSADCMLIMPSAPEKMRRALSELIQESEYFAVIPKNEKLIEMYFCFSIRQESYQ